jgi:hypothetical protein
VGTQEPLPEKPQLLEMLGGRLAIALADRVLLGLGLGEVDEDRRAELPRDLPHPPEGLGRAEVGGMGGQGRHDPRVVPEAPEESFG